MGSELHSVEGSDPIERACPLQERAVAEIAGRHAEAERLLGEAASLVDGRGRHEEAESLYERAPAVLRRALEALEAYLAPHHPHVVLCRENVAALEREAV